MTLSVSFHIDDARWKKLLAKEQSFFTKLVKKTCAEFELPKKKFGLAVVMTSDANIRALNRDFRHKDKPTNVLSFPQIEDFSSFEHIPQPIELGDIILAYETIAREIKEQNKNLRNHVAHLLVHGTLHLLGYDHMTKKEEKEMEAIEIKLLASVKIPNPY